MVDAIGNAPLPIAPVLSALPAEDTTAVVTSDPATQTTAADQVALSSQALQQQEQPQAPRANPEILGTISSVQYRSADGQVVTREVNKQTGKVTYSPANLPVLGNGAGNAAPSSFDITA